MKLRVGDVREKYGFFYLTVGEDTKTGSRSVPINDCVPYLRNYLRDHPLKDNLDAPLLWKLDHDSGRVEFLRPSRLTKKISEVVAKLRKWYPDKFPRKLTLHSTRRTCITEDVKEGKLGTEMICMKYWGSVHSKQIAEYTVLNEIDLLEAVNGKLTVRFNKDAEKKADAVKVRTCPRCHRACPNDGVYCASNFHHCH